MYSSPAKVSSMQKQSLSRGAQGGRLSSAAYLGLTCLCRVWAAGSAQDVLAPGKALHWQTIAPGARRPPSLLFHFLTAACRLLAAGELLLLPRPPFSCAVCKESPT